MRESGRGRVILIDSPVVSVILLVPVASYSEISMGKYLILLRSLPYSATSARSTASVASLLSVILMVKLSEEPFTVAETTPVLDNPFLSITTVVLPLVIVPMDPPGRLELLLEELPVPVDTPVFAL